VKLTEAKIEVEMGAGLSDETYDRLGDETGDAIEAVLDFELSALRDRLLTEFAAQVPGMKVTVDVG
jgi:hypothetical protein